MQAQEFTGCHHVALVAQLQDLVMLFVCPLYVVGQI